VCVCVCVCACVRACVCVCVCVFVFVFVCKHISGTTHPIFAHFTYVRGSGVVLKKKWGDA